MKRENNRREDLESIGFSHPTINKEEIIRRLRKKGYRITTQRKFLIDIILESENICCKEVYYNAYKKKARIGIATIYRFLNTLEEIGAIEKKNNYQVCDGGFHSVCSCIVEYCSGEKQTIDRDELYRAVEEGIRKLGIGKEEGIQNIIPLPENKEMK